ncbi:hypothetical protein QL093DRAFT_2343674 [Fusarium oxysporum]|nr:hypothetical protein QL093DRAFT_2343674 [Fusarium oxysporum]
MRSVIVELTVALLSPFGLIARAFSCVVKALSEVEHCTESFALPLLDLTSWTSRGLPQVSDGYKASLHDNNENISTFN